MGAGQSSSGGATGGGTAPTSPTSSAPAAPNTSAADAAAIELEAALTAAVEGAQVRTLFPVQKAALQCTLRCFDRRPASPADLHACSQACEAPVAAASSAFSHALAAYQARLGRCAAGCSDAASGRLGPDPSPSQVAAAQAAAGECVRGCAVAHQAELPTLAARMESDAGKAAAAASKP